MADFNHFPDLAKQLHDGLSQLVRKAAFDIEAAAKGSAPVATGNLRNSIYTLTTNGDRYPGSASGNLAPQDLTLDDDCTAFVAVAAGYGLYVEMGTAFMGSQPYLVPAVDRIRPVFEDACARLEDHLRG